MTKKIIVFGNQKGGTGKSTLAMHLVVNLLQTGNKIATIDVDARQGTFTRYIENREKTKKENPVVLTPVHAALFESEADSVLEQRKEDLANFSALINSLQLYDYIVVDTPGNDNYLSRVAHSFADVIITPMNESFIDLDLLVRISDTTEGQLKPSSYAEMVWNQKKEKAIRDKGMIDWIVLVNRMSSAASKNRYELDKVLSALSKRIGFRLAKGFKERVIFRELFLSGLTLLDRNVSSAQISLSHIAARQELNDLIRALNIYAKAPGASSSASIE
ncbi:MAG: division plane positioning ATPase MipZ [Holosporales bacterium]|jgi:chromosome partitioning protein|nr:division plane positioning ATPase MipZ [Holosporales bacterium]